MRRPPRDEPPRRPLRRESRPEGPFDRLLRQKPERDPAPLIIGGTVAFLAIVIVLVFVFSSLGGGDDGGGSVDGGGQSGDCAEFASGIRGCLASLPGLPPGLVAESAYVEFETQEDKQVKISMPLTEATQDPAGLGFYTYVSNRWQKLADGQLEQDGKLASAQFQVPKNLAVLRAVSQAYQVAGSLPHEGTLHADARPDIVTPRDYAPASDGSVQGTATAIPPEHSYAVLPTILGSGEDTAAVVDDILADEALRADHVQAIAALVQEGGFDGIDLEYSSVDVDLKGQFTAFVEALAENMHRESKRVSLTLPPPTNQRSAYDWKALGEAVDVIRILPIADPVTYWETMPGALGTVTDDVDPRKVMLVLSPYSIEDLGETARPIGYQQAMVLASQSVVREPGDPAAIKTGTTVRFVARNLDEGEGASPLRWDDDAAAVSFAVGGTERRRIFIENSFSFSFKLELVQAYGLGGVSVSDASSTSDVANVWPRVNELASSATISLVKPNDATLLPVWTAPDGGDLGAGAGTTATWVAPPQAGEFRIVLIVSDGERRFGQEARVAVTASDQASPSPIQTFAPDSGTPTGTATPTPGPSVTPSGEVTVEVGLVADADGNGSFGNDEVAEPGGDITYLVSIDNDSAVSVSIVSLVNSVYPGVDASCQTEDGDAVLGLTLAPDDGDAGTVGDLDGGPDELKCTFTATAPAESGESVESVITVTVRDEDGNVDADLDATTVTTS